MNRSIYPPEFCDGVVPPVLEIAGGIARFEEELSARGIRTSGIVPVRTFTKDVPDAPPPGEAHLEVFGDIELTTFEPDLTDSLKIWAKVTFSKDIGSLVPLLPTLIRGGAFKPGVSLFTFDEEQRLISISESSFIFSRLKDLFDFWIILRCALDLVMTAWYKKDELPPCPPRRHGIGPLELYKRLPGDNCGSCGLPNCMEFAVKLYKGQAHYTDCQALYVPSLKAHLKSLLWVMTVMGLDITPTNGRKHESPQADSSH